MQFNSAPMSPRGRCKYVLRQTIPAILIMSCVRVSYFTHTQVEGVHWCETEMKVFAAFLTANGDAYNCKLAYY